MEMGNIAYNGVNDGHKEGKFWVYLFYQSILSDPEMERDSRMCLYERGG
jgi:hypothetical protein